MARGVELATGYISLVVDTASIPDAIRAAMNKSTSAAIPYGRVLGRGIKRGIEAELGGFLPRMDARGSASANAAGRAMGNQMQMGMRQGFDGGAPVVRPNTASATAAGASMGRSMGSAFSASFAQAADVALPASMLVPFKAAGKGGSGLAAGLGAATLAAGGTAAAVAGVTVAAGALGIASARAGVDFTKSLNNMQAVTSATAGEMRAVRDQAMALGRDTSLSGVSAGQAAQVMAELSKGGFTVQQSMEAARGSLQLASAAQIDAAEAAVIQSNAMNAFRLEADQAGYVADVLANAANASSGEMSDFAYAMQAGSSVGQMFGMTIDDMVASLGMLANIGVKGSDAGTLVKSMMLQLASPSEPQFQAIEALGLDVWNDDGTFAGMGAMLEQLHQASKRLTPELYTMYTSTALGSDAARMAGVAASEGAAGFDRMRDALNQQGTAARVAAAQNEGLPGTINRISNTWDDLKLSIFGIIDAPLQEVGNALQAGLEEVVSWINSNKPEIIGFFTQMSDVVLAFVSSSIRSSAMMQKALSNSFGIVIEAVAKFATVLGSVMEKVPNFIAPGVAEMGRQLKGVGQFTDDLMDKWQNAGGTMDAMADKVDGMRDRLHNLGETTRLSEEFVRDLGGAAAEVSEGGGVVIKDNSPELIERLKAAGFAVQQMPDSKNITVKAETDQANAELDAWISKRRPEMLIGAAVSVDLKDGSGNPISFPQLQNLINGNSFGASVNAGGASIGGGGAFAQYDPAQGGLFGGNFAKGGDVTGGTAGRDSVLAALMPGEHVLDTGDVNAMGGQQAVYSFRRALKNGDIPGFEKGGAAGGDLDAMYEMHGAVSPAQKRAIDFAYAQSGKPYDYGGTGGPNRSFDCSGIASSTWAAMVGMPTNQRYFNTESDFTRLGFKPGFKAGALNVGIQRGGGGPNSHMALTLPNGVSMESGGAHGSVMYGQLAAGALDDQFDLQYYFDPGDIQAPESGGGGGSRGWAETQPASDGPEYPSITGDPLTDMLTPGKQNRFLNRAGITPASIGLGGEDYDPAQYVGGSTSGLSEDADRTAGFIPAAAGNTGVAGTSFVSGLLNMGSEVVNGLIDQAAQAASSAVAAGVAAGTMGAGAAGAPAAGAAANFAIGLGTSAAKRGVSYGFQMLGIGADALIEQLTPFGAPRWLGYDYTSFMPQLTPQGIGVTTGEKAEDTAAQSGGGDWESKVNDYWSFLPPGFGGGQPAGGSAMPGPQAMQPGQPTQPGAPVQPNQMPGMSQSISPPPDDWQRRMGLFDDGGWLEPGGIGINMSGRPEPVFSSQQWDAIKTATIDPAEAKANDYSIKIDNVTVSDVNSLKKELDDKQMLQMMRYAGRP